MTVRLLINFKDINFCRLQKIITVTKKRIFADKCQINKFCPAGRKFKFGDGNQATTFAENVLYERTHNFKNKVCNLLIKYNKSQHYFYVVITFNICSTFFLNHGEYNS